MSERHSLRPWSCFVTVYYDLVVVLCIFIYVSRIMYPNRRVVSKTADVTRRREALGRRPEKCRNLPPVSILDDGEIALDA